MFLIDCSKNSFISRNTSLALEPDASVLELIKLKAPPKKPRLRISSVLLKCRDSFLIIIVNESRLPAVNTRIPPEIAINRFSKTNLTQTRFPHFAILELSSRYRQFQNNLQWKRSQTRRIITTLLNAAKAGFYFYELYILRYYFRVVYVQHTRL